MSTLAKLAFQNSIADAIELNAQDIVISDINAQDISLNLSSSDVHNMIREGSDLILTLANGEVIILERFFTDYSDGSKNRLYLSESDQIEIVDLSHLDTAVLPIDLEFTPEIIFQDSSVAAILSPLGLISAIGGTAASGAAVLSGGSDNSVASLPPVVIDTDVVAPTIDTIITNTDDTLSVSGTGEPRAEVTITYNDG